MSSVPSAPDGTGRIHVFLNVVVLVVVAGYIEKVQKSVF